MMKNFKSVTSHDLVPPPVTKLSHLLRPLPSSVTYIMDGRLRFRMYSQACALVQARIVSGGALYYSLEPLAPSPTFVDRRAAAAADGFCCCLLILLQFSIDD